MTKKLKSLNQPETKLLEYLRKHPELFERLNAIVELSEGKEPSAAPEDNAPVTAAWRYLSNRRNSLDYARALENDLPIGSGLIESGRKHVLHARLKKAGSAWLESSAHLVSQLRILRSNKQWSILWN